PRNQSPEAAPSSPVVSNPPPAPEPPQHTGDNRRSLRPRTGSRGWTPKAPAPPGVGNADQVAKAPPAPFVPDRSVAARAPVSQPIAERPPAPRPPSPATPPSAPVSS